jgi:diheme cytochrome c
LTDHFGEDASLTADKVELIRAYMAANAGDVTMQGRARKYMQWVAPGGTPLRITENPDFQRKHRFADSVWKDPKVLTRSNCLACHSGAEQGRYE